ncbi:UbiA family prenyltransferase [Dokdonella soli]
MTRTLTEASRPRLTWPLLRLLSCIRFDEVFLLQGTALFGALYSIGTLTKGNLFVLAVVVAGSLSLVAHVFVLNDWSGIRGDLRDPARSDRTFVTRGVSRAEFGYLAVVLLALALSLFWLLGTIMFAIALAIAIVSALYSAPPFHMKGLPVFNSVLHLVGGALHFLLGYAAFSAIDERGVAIACFFALVFTAGHLMHETRGYVGDSLNGIRTNALAFGKVHTFIAGLALFTAAYALLAALAASGAVPHVLLFAAALYPLHLCASLWALRSGLTFERLRQLQRLYRLLFAVIGIAMIMTVPLRMI